MLYPILRVILIYTLLLPTVLQAQQNPSEIPFFRQAVKRIVFDTDQQLSLAELNPDKLIGLTAMHPQLEKSTPTAEIAVSNGALTFSTETNAMSSLWLGGFNPFATYSMILGDFSANGALGFEFSDASKQHRFIVKIEGEDNALKGARIFISKGDSILTDTSILTVNQTLDLQEGKLILQLLGSGLVLYLQQQGLPVVIGQFDYNQFMDLREKSLIQQLHTAIYTELQSPGCISVKKADITLNAGMGQADIRAITYENGDPLLDQGKLWYTMTIRGRALPHHLQGVFSMEPSTFEVKFEGIIVFDRQDGLLRNEVASHLFYDRQSQTWKGITTGFSAYANIQQEKKQLLAVESKKDPRFGYSIMQASTFGIVGDIEDPHILYDQNINKWRLLACENMDGYKAVMMESEHWNKDYRKIAGPVLHNSTGTSIQKMDGALYCFAGSSERAVFIYSYPDLKEVGTLKMDLPPWDKEANTRTWPNVVQLPEGYPMKYIALMMDRFNYPGMSGPNWTYGALYLYYGY